MYLAGQTDRRTDVEAGLFPRPQLLQLQRRRPRVKTRNRVSLASTYGLDVKWYSPLTHVRREVPRQRCFLTPVSENFKFK